MVTGVEVAGLALAIFPVVLRCLQFYLKSFQEAKKWWRYIKVAKSLIQDLEMEKMKFENICEELLFEIVEPAELDLLLAQPGGPRWQIPHLQIALKNGLGRSFGIYLETVSAVKDTLDSLQTRLQRAIPEEPHDRVRTVDRLRLLRLSLTDESNRSLLNTLARHTSDLGLLLGHRKRITALNTARPLANTRTLSAFREKAKSVFDLIRTDVKARCQCAGCHTVGLRLEMRCDLEASLDKAKASFNEEDILRTLFVFESKPQIAQPSWRWRHISFKPRSSGQRDSSTPQVSLQSTVLSESMSTEGRASSTLLVDGNNNDHVLPKTVPEGGLSSDQPQNTPPQFRRHIKKYFKKVTFASISAEAPPTPPPTSGAEAVASESLEGLQGLEGLCEIAQKVKPHQELVRLAHDNESGEHEVQVKGHESNSQPISFTPLFDAIGEAANVDRKTTVMLAITLTATVLQLHDTPWLSDDWSNHDMMLPDIRKGDANDLTLCQPYICKPLGQQDELDVPNKSAAKSLPPQIRNLCLCSLGAALIEIWFGQTMDELRKGEGVEQIALSEDAPNVTLAFHLIDRVYRQAGDWYGDAVRRCLYCDFNQRHTELRHSSMKGAVYDGVMVPLIEHLKALHGGSLNRVQPLSFSARHRRPDSVLTLVV